MLYFQFTTSVHSCLIDESLLIKNRWIRCFSALLMETNQGINVEREVKRKPPVSSDDGRM